MHKIVDPPPWPRRVICNHVARRITLCTGKGRKCGRWFLWHRDTVHVRDRGEGLQKAKGDDVILRIKPDVCCDDNLSCVLSHKAKINEARIRVSCVSRGKRAKRIFLRSDLAVTVVLDFTNDVFIKTSRRKTKRLRSFLGDLETSQFRLNHFCVHVHFYCQMQYFNSTCRTI